MQKLGREAFQNYSTPKPKPPKNGKYYQKKILFYLRFKCFHGVHSLSLLTSYGTSNLNKNVLHILNTMIRKLFSLVLSNLHLIDNNWIPENMW